jgi:HEPN domain-containing protein
VPHRHEDWLEQARSDLTAARNSLAAQDYDWCSFQCQQSAEKTLKALLRFHKKEVRGHDLSDLIEAVTDFVHVPEAVVTACDDLDAHYFRPRYPDSIASGYPAEFYDEKIAYACIKNANTILAFVEANVS